MYVCTYGYVFEYCNNLSCCPILYSIYIHTLSYHIYFFSSSFYFVFISLHFIFLTRFLSLSLPLFILFPSSYIFLKCHGILNISLFPFVLFTLFRLRMKRERLMLLLGLLGQLIHEECHKKAKRVNKKE